MRYLILILIMIVSVPVYAEPEDKKASEVSATSSATLPGPSTEPAASVVTKPTATATELGKLQIEFDKIVNNNRKEIEKLQEQIAALKTDGQDPKKKIEQLQTRIDLLEQLNQQRQKNIRNLDQIRFETGKNILNVLIEKSSTLKVATGLGVSLSGFQSTLNPMNDTSFVSEIKNLQAGLNKVNSKVLDSPAISGLMANPYVSLVMSVVTVFVSDTPIFGADAKAQERLTQLKNVICVTDFTSKTVSDFQLIDSGIGKLDERLRAFNTTTKKERFKNYAATVAYDHDWDKYQVDKLKDGQDPVTSLTDTFFKALPDSSLADSTPQGISRLRYQVENVKMYIAEYESLIQEVNNFYSVFASIISKNAQMPTSSMCSANPSITNIKSSLSALLPTVAQAKKDFESAYIVSIPPESRRVLFSR